MSTVRRWHQRLKTISSGGLGGPRLQRLRDTCMGGAGWRVTGTRPGRDRLCSLHCLQREPRPWLEAEADAEQSFSRTPVLVRGSVSLPDPCDPLCPWGKKTDPAKVSSLSLRWVPRSFASPHPWQCHGRDGATSVCSLPAQGLPHPGVSWQYPRAGPAPGPCLLLDAPQSLAVCLGPQGTLKLPAQPCHQASMKARGGF